MKKLNNIPVTIIGGGPVGLFLAICLLRKGIECRVLEKRTAPVSDSRSLGIHPISLEMLDALGISDAFLKKGVKIRKGIALNEKNKLGEISFLSIPKPFNFILACPQFYTEQILRDELLKLNQNALVSGAEFKSFTEKGDSVIVEYIAQETGKITSNFLIGCDGKNSSVRQQASIHFSGIRYPDTYIMGDFEDSTNFGEDAAVFLPKNGLIESFPLPNKKRRWVIKTEEYERNPAKELLVKLVSERIEFQLNAATCEMLSSFGVQHLMAETLVKHRIALAGDAAHVVSPIGGQGMNLGWIGAWRLAESLKEVISERKNHEELKKYSIQQKKTVSIVARRAEMNMRLGRKTSFPYARNLIVKAMLNTPFQNKAANLFTMRGLEFSVHN